VSVGPELDCNFAVTEASRKLSFSFFEVHTLFLKIISGAGGCLGEHAAWRGGGLAPPPLED